MAEPRKHLNMIIHSLYVMRYGFGSQCKSIRAGVMWSKRFKPRPNEQQNSTQTVAAGQETKANAQEHYYNNPTDYEPRHAPKRSFDSTDKAFHNQLINQIWKLQFWQTHKTCWDIVMLLSSITPKSLTVWTGAMRLPKSSMSFSTKLSCLRSL